MLIPTEYIEHTQERLSLYLELNKLKSEEEIEEYTEKLKDRFGRDRKSVV